MAKTPEEFQRRQERFDAYERRATTPLLINGFVFLGAFMTVLTDRDPFSSFLLRFSWAVFIVDYAIMLYLTPHRWKWFTKHLYYLVAIFFPILRIILLVMLALRLSQSRNSPLRDRVGVVAIYFTACVIVFGAYFVWRFERGQPGATIETYGESLWWAVVTITTVGYGDYVPVTVPGRIVAVIVLFNGIAAIAVLTGVVVSFFSSDVRRLRRSRSDDTDPVTLRERIRRLREAATHAPDSQHTVELAAIERRLGALETSMGVGHPPDRSQPMSDPPNTLAQRTESEPP